LEFRGGETLKMAQQSEIEMRGRLEEQMARCINLDKQLQSKDQEVKQLRSDN
jgi:hypothetical protein